MNPDQVLARLAALCGIQPEYYDLWNQPHPCSDETRRTFLQAMHLRAGTDAETLESLETFEADLVRRPTPPAIVASHQDQPLEVPLWIPEPEADHSHQWRLGLENGGVQTGDFHPYHLHSYGQQRVLGTRYLRVGLPLPLCPDPGYHTLEILGRETSTARLIITPQRCFLPQALQEDGRLWGFTTQLYSLRSRRNWGMGDFTDLRSLVEYTAQAGGDLVGTNPLHALFPHDPDRASPYGPSTQRFFNILYLDVEAVPDFAECEEAKDMVRNPEFQASLRALRGSALVEYRAVAAFKFPLLERLYRHFMEHHLSSGSPRAQEFQRFRQESGRDLEGLALFQALQERFHSENDSIHGWLDWPEEYRHPESPAVQAFAAEHGERIGFFEYLQWQTSVQFGSVAQGSQSLGLGLGLYGDLAIGVHRSGAETWLHPSLYALEASVGAPADDFNLHGQDWGFPPLIPHQLVNSAFEPFISALRANMRHTGALRIDHVMGLMRLFWVPVGSKPSDGAYVAYPFQELLGILALESQRNQCLVVGEDLGTVPDEVRSAMRTWGTYSCHPLYFERDYEDGSFKPPARYPEDALASVGTHDLPTLNGYWQGHDLDLRNSLGLFPSEAIRENQVVERARDQAQLLVALEKEGLISGEPGIHPVAHPVLDGEMVRLIHLFLARSPAKLLVVQPEDVLGQVEPMNLPGSLDWQHPNWRRKLSLDLEEWGKDPRFLAVSQTLQETRGRRPRAEEARSPGSPAEARIPQSTYRLQFCQQFTFAQAIDLVPYLRELGITHCYASPLLKARPASNHGYDIIDHGSLNPEIASHEDFQRLVDTLHQHGMGLIVDIVPNHMAVMSCENAWWQDVLENGPVSLFANYFDIDWHPLKKELHGKILLPVLGDQYGRVLEGGGLSVHFDGSRGEFRVAFHDHHFLTDPREYPKILLHDIDRLAARLGPSAMDLLELQSIATAFGHLPSREDISRDAVAERARDKEIHKQHLAQLWSRSEDIRLYLDENVRSFNGSPGDPRSFDPLHHFLECQAYRLAYWWVAADEINYRRFFDINDLAGLRIERDEVFDATHGLLLELVQRGDIDGFRIDHPDGLYDPWAYFQRLQRRSAEVMGQEPGGKSIYLVAEKILSKHERLPEDWAIHGATGYRFANDVNGLFVDASAEEKFDQIYRDFTGETLSFDEILYQSKRLIVRTSMASEWNVLANELSKIALSAAQTRDFTMNSLRDALLEVVACFPVYRTYLRPGHLTDQERHHLEWAIGAARQRSPWTDSTVFDFLQEVLTTQIAKGRLPDYADRVNAFAIKFQQYSAPVMAKGMEDTSFYRYNRLVSLNDVGSDPRVFGTSLSAFHHVNAERCRSWPHSLLASSTHDSKRSEDVRLRIDALSELGDEWEKAVNRWARMNRSKKIEVDGQGAPSPNDEYLLYQTLVGVWPSSWDAEGIGALRERVQAYLLKAAREAKVHTSWVRTHAEYERAITTFVESILATPDKNPFVADLTALVNQVAPIGMLSGLSMALIKCTAPGVPDTYQGCELSAWNLVDPDNRRVVDFGARLKVLEQLRGNQGTPPVLERAGDGSAKFFVIWKALNSRLQNTDLFENGDYNPLHAEGPLADHICAFLRKRGEEMAITVAPRLFGSLRKTNPGWPMGDLWVGHWLDLPTGGTFTDAITGERCSSVAEENRHGLRLNEVLSRFPVALLIKQ